MFGSDAVANILDRLREMPSLERDASRKTPHEKGGIHKEP